jgi:hypothetical protein
LKEGDAVASIARLEGKSSTAKDAKNAEEESKKEKGRGEK